MMNFSIKSLKGKLLLCFMILIIPIVVEGAVAYNSSLGVVTNMAIDSVESMIDRIDYETDRLMSDMQNFATMVSRDSTFQMPLRKELPENIEEVYRQRLDYNYKLFYSNQYRDEVRGIYVIGENGARFKSSMMTLQDRDFREDDWYQTILESEEGVWFEPHAGSFAAITVGEDFISVGVPIVDRFSGSTLGVVLVDVEVERFQNNFDAQLVRKGEVVLLNTQNKILLGPSSDADILKENVINGILEQTNFMQRDSAQTIEVEGQRYLVSYKTSATNGWKTMGIIPFNEISKDASAITATILLLIAISCIAVAFFSVKATSWISRPIHGISNTMKKVRDGDMEVRAKVEVMDEVGELAVNFNNMIEQIKVLMKTEEENQKKLRKAELRALQAQINPHFLYNTLDSISWMARSKNVDQLDEMIEALTMLFRISLSRGKDLIILEDEIKHVHSYLRIQQVRYRKKISYMIDIPQELCKNLIVKMTLQPLVENAIYHGIKEKKGKGMVIITGESDGDDLVLKVKDTGKGMKQETLEELNKAILMGEEYTNTQNSKLDSYGVLNVHKRIQMYFGEQYGLHYESKFMEGTTATIRLPKKEKE